MFMLIQMRTIVVKPGNADKVIERFSGQSPLDGSEGLLDVTVMANNRSKEYDVKAVKCS
jgi:heme oxygenase (staphylobilin-producing)